jgi:hypothetical protein
MALPKESNDINVVLVIGFLMVESDCLLKIFGRIM